MKWIKPEFKEISLCMEATAYVNTDGSASRPVAAKPAGVSAPEAKTGKERTR